MPGKNGSRKTKPARNVLPYVQVATFCEAILEDKDGMLSAVRVFDKITIAPPPPAEQVTTPAVLLKVLVMLKSGSVKGKRRVELVVRSPSGESVPGIVAPAVFEGGEHGVNVQAQVTLGLVGEGLYWCDVLVNNSLVTRMPLRVLYSTPPEPQLSDKPG